MKKTAVVFHLPFLCSVTSAQTQFWQQQITRTYCVSLAALLALSQGLGQWIQSNGPVTYRGVEMQTVFTKGESLYVGCYQGGAYFSTNHGLSWVERNNGFPWSYQEYTDVNSFLLNDDWLLAATSNGVYRSDSFGESWSESNTGLPTPYSMDGLIQVAGQISGGTEHGVYVSNDHGVSWTADTIGLFRTPLGVVTYVRTLATIGSTRFAGTANGVYVSPAPGTPWHQANVGIIPRVGSSYYPPVVSFLISGQNILAGTDYGGGVYLSTNMGATWIQTSNGLPVTYAGFIPAVRSMTEVNGYLFASVQDFGVYRSSDYGSNWVLANSGLPVEGYAGEMGVSNGDVLAATFGGLFLTTNNGLNWNPVFTRFPTFMSVRSITTTDGGLVASAFCERWDCNAAGVFRSTDEGTSWIQLSTPFEYASKLVYRQGEVYGCSGQGVYLSTDSGTNWESRSGGLPGYPVNDLAFHNGGLVAALGLYITQISYGGVFISTNGGILWNAANLSNQNIQAVASTGDYILAASANFLEPSGVYRSSNYGQTWEQLTSGLPTDVIVLSFLNRGTAVYAATYQGVYITTNSGSTWVAANSGLENGTSVYGLTQNSSTILCATSAGVYASTNDGGSWQVANNGFTATTQTYSIGIHAGRVLAGTNYGVWYRPIDEITSVLEQVPQEYLLQQNYPNPFNPTTTIRYGLSHASFVTLTVYNTLGQQVAQLVNEQQQAGNHETVFRGDELASGVYFYRVQAGDFAASKKLLLLK